MLKSLESNRNFLPMPVIVIVGSSSIRVDFTNETEVVATRCSMPPHCRPGISQLKLEAKKRRKNVQLQKKIMCSSPAASVKLNDPDEAVFLDRLRQTLLPPTKVSNLTKTRLIFYAYNCMKNYYHQC